MREKELVRLLAREAGNVDLLDVDAWGPDGIVVNIDGYTASRSRLPFMSWEDWGYKATVAAASDVIVAGARPVAIAYSVGAESADVLVSVARGVGLAASEMGAKVYKGDANWLSGDAWIDVAVVGLSDRPVKRSGARPGDVVVQVGYLGYGAVASRVLESRLDLRDAPREAIERARRPRPLSWAADLIARYASSASDNSDGWALTLYNIARASGVRIDLDEVVVDPALRGLISEEEALYSWEDYNLALTVPRESLDALIRACEPHCWAVGRVSEGSGVYLRGRVVEERGWSWW